MMRDQAGQLERPPRVILRRPLDDRPHRFEAAHRRDEPLGPLALRMGEKTLRITVEKPEQTRPDLLNVMLGHPVVLLQQPVIGEDLGQLDALSEIRARQTAIRPAHRLIPQELDRVAIPGDPRRDLSGTRHRRAVGGGQMLSAEADEMIETVDEHPRIAIRLAANCEHVEQRRPHQVVDRQRQLREPERHRVISIRRRRPSHHLQPCHLEHRLVTEGDRGRHMTNGVRGVLGEPIRPPEADIDQAVGAVLVERHRELLNETT